MLLDERLPENAAARGVEMRAFLSELAAEMPHIITAVRGRGLLNAVVINPEARDARGVPLTAWDVCIGLKDAAVRFGAPYGILAKPTHGNIIRLAPPLVITPAQLGEVQQAMATVMRALASGMSRVQPAAKVAGAPGAFEPDVSAAFVQYPRFRSAPDAQLEHLR